MGIDSAIEPLVEALNTAGIRTFQSCSGHEDSESYPSAHVWIEEAALDDKRAQVLSEQSGIEQVAKLFGREKCPVWEIIFIGETNPLFEFTCGTIENIVTQGW